MHALNVRQEPLVKNHNRSLLEQTCMYMLCTHTHTHTFTITDTPSLVEPQTCSTNVFFASLFTPMNTLSLQTYIHTIYIFFLCDLHTHSPPHNPLVATVPQGHMATKTGT